MRSSYLAAFLHAPLAASAYYCPPSGPTFPVPQTLASNTPFQKSLGDLEAAIRDAFASGNSSHGPVNPNDTYSIQIFSTKDEAPLLDFHRPGVGLVGNSSLDGDSIYRIASTTKLITVYLLLLAAGDGILHESVTKWLPELTGKGYWDEITVGALAGYLAGVVSDVYGGESISNGGLAAAFPGAFPPLDPEELSPCPYGQSGCTREIFLEHLATRRQVYLPNTTPAYSNAGFATLGLVLESVTGLSYGDSLRKLLNDPLKLKGTSEATPSDSSRGVIIGSEGASAWNSTIDQSGIGMGAMFSSANDMTAVGRAILSSSLLPSNTTRAWFKPVTHTSSLIGAVGYGWEIFRSTLGPAENNRVIDLYTKSGNYGAYGANFVLLPDYEVGFIVLSAASQLRGRVPFELSGVIVDHLVPALEEAGRAEAEANLAGTYTAANGVNSTVTLTTTPGVPGLTIEQWLSNGTDISKLVFGASSKGFQMYPTNIQSEDGKKQSWRSGYLPLVDTGAFSACPSWVILDRPTYGVYGLDEFEFTVDENGKATSVEPKALKLALQRQ